MAAKQLDELTAVDSDVELETAVKRGTSELPLSDAESWESCRSSPDGVDAAKQYDEYDDRPLNQDQSRRTLKKSSAAEASSGDESKFDCCLKSGNFAFFLSKAVV